jgi:hypothetical protein
MADYHFHADAHALVGKLNLPFDEQIKEQALVTLDGHSQTLLLEGEERKLKGKKSQKNYFSQQAKDYRLANIISYSAAHTQVAGHRSDKNPNAFVTLATSSVEGLNVLNVVTADRVVAQIATTHFPEDYSPQVTFLGTHFENLRIAGHKTLPRLNLAFVGHRPKGSAYYPTRGTPLMASVEKQYQRLRDEFGKLKPQLEPDHLERLDWHCSDYHGFSDFDYARLEIEVAAADAKERSASISSGVKWGGVTYSLVEQIEIEGFEIATKNEKSIGIPTPARSFGHIIHVPDFGTIFLAEMKVNHNSFNLTMIRLEMGCVASGGLSIATCNVNGKRGGGGGNGSSLAGNGGTHDR